MAKPCLTPPRRVALHWHHHSGHAEVSADSSHLTAEQPVGNQVLQPAGMAAVGGLTRMSSGAVAPDPPNNPPQNHVLALPVNRAQV